MVCLTLVGVGLLALLGWCAELVFSVGCELRRISPTQKVYLSGFGAATARGYENRLNLQPSLGTANR